MKRVITSKAIILSSICDAWLLLQNNLTGIATDDVSSDE
jgi:hypothetical protein